MSFSTILQIVGAYNANLALQHSANLRDRKMAIAIEDKMKITEGETCLIKIDV